MGGASRLALLAICLSTALLSACAAPTKIVSNKATNYTAEPKRIFVLTNIGPDFGQDFSDSFQGKLAALVRGCGAVVEVSRISSLELDESVHAARMTKFRPDTLMTLRRSGGTRNEFGLLLDARYDAKLIDVRSNKTVWRAEAVFNRGGTAIPLSHRGEAFAVDLTNKLKEDGIFRSCEAGQAKP